MISRNRRARLSIAALTLLVSLVSCGDDDERDDARSRVAAACQAACQQAIGSCGLPAPRASDCAAVCQLGATIAPVCAGTYEAFVNCTYKRLPLRCDPNGVSVSTSIAGCVAPLGDYFGCAGGALGAACLALPLQDADCVAASLGARALGCAQAPNGCRLFEGTSRAGGFGMYCCP